MPADSIYSLYLDLVEHGGLAGAMRAAFRDVGSTLSPTELDPPAPSVVFAYVKDGNRMSQVYIAGEERLFLFDFWGEGVMLADGQTADLHEVARAIDLWIAKACSCTQLATDCPCVTLRHDALIFERGEEVEYTWQMILSSIHRYNAALSEFVHAAAAQPALRQLFPYTSLHRFFCFSRCTGHPYTHDIPRVDPLPDGRYEVIGTGGRSLGIGSAEFAAALVVASLPAGCGPAVRGTAEDLPGAIMPEEKRLH